MRRNLFPELPCETKALATRADERDVLQRPAHPFHLRRAHIVSRGSGMKRSVAGLGLNSESGVPARWLKRG